MTGHRRFSALATNLTVSDTPRDTRTCIYHKDPTDPHRLPYGFFFKSIRDVGYVLSWSFSILFGPGNIRSKIRLIAD